MAISTITVRLEDKSLDLAKLHTQAALNDHDNGAQVIFTGFVRQHDHHHAISHLLIEHYPEVTELEILHIVEQAQQKWNILDNMVVHRIGKILVGEPIVWVSTLSTHRKDAYAANEFIMDYLKVLAPFWKKECFQNGHEQWVTAKTSDHLKQQQWINN